MLVACPTLMWDVPGFLNTSILWLRESNAPGGLFRRSPTCARYIYDTHPMFGTSWGIPVNEHWSFEGFLNFIAAKGVDETVPRPAPRLRQNADGAGELSFLGRFEESVGHLNWLKGCS
ncbi:hypothetical protein MasN3_05990 [Massilia varians]|uniref:Uncharacterized protein n=1 Tax=Massilia varians TaxID=457921 RepID=A0ABM8C1V2_9BURK|nr:hypothetical protein [Massilia varians]BDT57105.1 hypothetical protein MasN3_05990 [Massilia varians]